MECPTNVPDTRYNQFRRRTKPATPIEIPARRRRISSLACSPGAQPISPEFIFDMSPLSHELPSTPHFSRAFSPSRRLSDHERFMYNFPVFSARSLNSRRQSSSDSSSSPQPFPPVDSSSGSRPISAGNVPPTPTSVLYAQQIDYAISDVESSFQNFNAAVANKTTKITGFAPTMHNQASVVPETHLQSKPKLPPPRKMSFSSSPQVIPGRSDRRGGNNACSPPDPTVLDFHKHLFQRIDSTKPVRFRNLPIVF